MKDDAGKYEVTLSNNIGSKTETIDVIVLDKPGPPAGPVRFDDISNDYVTFSWDVPEYTGGCQISNYIVEKRDTTSTSWQIVSATVARTTIKVARLKTGAEYQFRIFAENRYGKSIHLDSAPVIVQYQFKEPGPPGTPFVTTVTKESMVVEWNIPVSDGGSKVLGYNLERKEKNSILWTKLNNILISGIKYKTTGLDIGVEYEFRVFALNIVGIGKPSKTSALYVARDPCDPPGRPEAIIITRNSVSLQWTKPVYDGGSKITGYIVEKRELPEGRWMKASFTNVIETEFTVSGLTEGTRYEYRIIARNAAGSISEPSESTGPITATDEVEAPRISMDPKFKEMVVVNAGSTIVVDADVHGKPLPEIKWFKGSNELEGNTARMEIRKAMQSTTLTIKDLIRTDSGHYVLEASNVGGKKSLSVNIKILDRPGPPQGPLAISGVTADKCYLNWNPPLEDGGASIDHYVVEKRETSRLSWTQVSSDVVTCSLKVTKILSGNEYIFRVMAVNKYGIGDPLDSEPVVACNPFTVPGPPQTPDVTTITKDSMIVVWGRPENDGGAEIEGYILEKRAKDGMRWTKCNKKRLNDLRFRVVALNEGQYYEFRVSAENSAGVGKESQPSIFFQACDAIFQPGPPIHPKVQDTTSSSASLSWSKPIYNGGAEIVGYVVETQEVNSDEWVIKTPPSGQKTTQMTVVDLKQNCEYKFRISAMNSAGVGEAAVIPDAVLITERVEAPEIELDADLRKVVSIFSGTTLRLFVTIKGRPEPEVKWEKEEGSISSTAVIDTTSSYSMIVIDNVNRFDSGKYFIHLENNSGKKSAFINVRVLDSPSAPLNLTIKEVGKNFAILSWEPPQIDGGAKITAYVVEKRESTRKAYTTVTNNCHKHTFRVDNLLEGCYYIFRVLAMNEYGVGLPTETEQPIRAAEVPSPPGKVTVVDVTRSTTTLSWQKPESDGGSKITSYIVEMQTKGSSKWSVCATVKMLDATIQGLISGEEYIFRVVAVNEVGRSEPIQLGVPIIAKDIEIKPTVDLAFNTFSVIAGEDLIIDLPCHGRPHPDIMWKKEGQPLKETTRVNVHSSKSSTKLTIKEASKDDVGKYELIVSNNNGTKTYHISIIVLDKPSPPNNVRIEDVSAESVTLSWDVPDYDGGCQINNYIVEKRETSTTIWTLVSATVARTSIKVLRLVTGSEYQFRIYAENRYGKSHHAESPMVVVEFPFKSPGPPGTPKVFATSKDHMIVEWQPPVNDGGSKVLGYHLEYKEKNSIIWMKANKMTITDSKMKVIGLELGLFYEYRVYAQNIAGIGKCSKVSEPVAARDPCDPPGQPEVKNITRNSVSLAWKKPEYDGGAKITGYIVEQRELPEGRWLKCNFTNILETSYDVTGLTEDLRYEFRVIARNAADQYSEPSESTGPITIKDDIEVPRIMMDIKYKDIVVVKAGDVLKIAADFSGRPYPVVSWTKDGRNIEELSRIEVHTVDNSTTVTVKDSIRRDSGQYVLTLHNVAGSRSATFNCKVLDRPAPPAGPIAISKVTSEKITLSWGCPIENGGAEIDHYVVEKRETSRLSWTQVYSDLPVTQCKVTKIIKGNEYIFRVMGVNKYGVGEPLESEPVKAVDPYTLPKPPKNVEIINITKESMVLCWERPEDDGGSEISGYIIERKEKNGTRWVRVNKKPVYDFRTKASGLHEGMEYEFRVSAENAAGVGPASDASPLTCAEDPVFISAPPSKPKICDSTKSSIVISWKKPLFDGGSSITGYIVEYKEKVDTEWTTAIQNFLGNEFTVKNLVHMMEYQFRIIAINKMGQSDPSEASDVVAAKEREEEPSIELDNEMRKAVVVRAGSSFKLQMSFKGRPTPQITWSKPDSDLILRASIENTSKSSVLSVEKCKRSDSGKYTVTLQNPIGSASVTLTVKVLDTPGQPGEITIADVTNESAVLTWDIPENDGGSSVKNYHIEKREATKKAWVSVTSNCQRLTYKIKGLQEGALYHFRVMGENEFGIGVPVESKEPVRATKKPGAPEKLGVTSITKDCVCLSWLKPEHDGGSRIVGYVVEMLEKGKQAWIHCAFVKTTQYAAQGLRENMELFFRVMAQNEAGLGEPRELLMPVLVKDQLDKPNLDLKNFPHHTVFVKAGAKLLFDIPISGKPLPKIIFSKNNVVIKPSLRFDYETTAEACVVCIKECTIADAGKYDITATNSSGRASTYLNIVVLDRPGPPIGPVVISHVMEDSVSLKWEPPEYDGGSQVTNYIISKRDVSSGTWSDVSSMVARNVMKVTRLTTGEEYQFRIKAENRFGISDYLDSASVTVKLPYTTPGAPSTPLIKSVTKESMVVSWNQPVTDGGSPVLGYHLEMKDRNSILWQRVNRALIRSIHLKVNVMAGLIYEFRVYAENAAGVGKVSNPSEPKFSH
uniref:Titin n=1 Tax=Eptatretus burgeri TaxID=7764 RepID=A0A8C4R519_EPTBU